MLEEEIMREGKIEPIAHPIRLAMNTAANSLDAV
jgi:hypothetical protein